MGVRSIGELVAPIIAQALGIGRLQEFLEQFDLEDRAYWIMTWLRDGTIDQDEAALLLDHNERRAA